MPRPLRRIRLAFLWLAQVWRAKARRQWQPMPSAQRFFSPVVPPLAAINAWGLISSFLGLYQLASQIGFLLLLVVGALALLAAQFSEHFGNRQTDD